MNNDINIAPILRYLGTGVVVLVAGFILSHGFSGSPADLFATLFCMALVAVVAGGLLVMLNNEWARSKTLKLPRKQDRFVS